MLMISVTMQSFIHSMYYDSLYFHNYNDNYNDNYYIITNITLTSKVINNMIVPWYTIDIQHSQRIHLCIEGSPFWSAEYDGIAITCDTKQITLQMDLQVSNILLFQLYDRNFKEIPIYE